MPSDWPSPLLDVAVLLLHFLGATLAQHTVNSLLTYFLFRDAGPFEQARLRTRFRIAAPRLLSLVTAMRLSPLVGNTNIRGKGLIDIAYKRGPDRGVADLAMMPRLGPRWGS